MIFYIAIYETNEIRRGLLRRYLRKFLFAENLAAEILWMERIPGAEHVEQFFPLVRLALVSLDSPDSTVLTELIYKKNPDCRILFFDGDSKDVIHLLHTRPFGYEPCQGDCLTEYDFFSLLRATFDDMEKFSDLIRLENRSGVFFLPSGEILYFQSDLKNVLVSTVTGKAVSLTAKLSNVQSVLQRNGQGRDFIRIHQSYLVNAEHIRLLDKKNHQVVLSNGESLPISDSRYNSIIQSLKQVE